MMIYKSVWSIILESECVTLFSVRCYRFGTNRVTVHIKVINGNL